MCCGSKFCSHLDLFLQGEVSYLHEPPPQEVMNTCDPVNDNGGKKNGGFHRVHWRSPIVPESVTSALRAAFLNGGETLNIPISRRLRFLSGM